MTEADQYRAFRTTAEREIERIDQELRAHPHSLELSEQRRDWARVAYLATAALERMERNEQSQIHA